MTFYYNTFQLSGTYIITETEELLVQYTLLLSLYMNVILQVCLLCMHACKLIEQSILHVCVWWLVGMTLYNNNNYDWQAYSM